MAKTKAARKSTAKRKTVKSAGTKKRTAKKSAKKKTTRKTAKKAASKTKAKATRAKKKTPTKAAKLKSVKKAAKKVTRKRRKTTRRKAPRTQEELNVLLKEVVQLRRKFDMVEKGKKIGAVKPYKATEKFQYGDRVDHPRFGTGVVQLIKPKKVEVAFPEGMRVLVHARANRLPMAAMA